MARRPREVGLTRDPFRSSGTPSAGASVDTGGTQRTRHSPSGRATTRRQATQQLVKNSITRAQHRAAGRHQRTNAGYMLDARCDWLGGNPSRPLFLLVAATACERRERHILAAARVEVGLVRQSRIRFSTTLESGPSVLFDFLVMVVEDGSPESDD